MSRTTSTRQPYVGLVPYREEDWEFFFGREPEQEVITSNLRATRLTVLYGPTGVGKSSVLRAGVAHNLKELALRNKEVRNNPEFAVVVFNSWQADLVPKILSAVKAALLQVKAAERERIEALSHDSLAKSLKNWTTELGVSIYLIFDQFEEYFVYHPQENGDRRFLEEFPKALNNPNIWANFLISIREDALAKLDRFKGRIPNLFDNYLRIEHLDYESARDAVIKPVEQYNRKYAADGEQVEIDPLLVDEVLSKAPVDEPLTGLTGSGSISRPLGSPTPSKLIAAPALQLIMMRLWDEEMRLGTHKLRCETLNNRLGGREKIVQTYVDEFMDQLSEPEKKVAASISKFLVTPSGTKIALSALDLARFSREPQAEIEKLLARLSDPLGRRILLPVEPSAGLQRYQIYHDVLAPAILDWQTRYEQRQERLAREEQLKRQKEEAKFLEAQRNAAEQAEARARAQEKIALDQHKIARSHAVAASALSQLFIDTELSVLLAIEAARLMYTELAEDALRQALLESHLRKALRRHNGPVNTVQFSPDGKRIVTSSRDNTARVWDVETGQVIFQLPDQKQWVTSAVFSPDGKQILTACGDKTVRIWDIETGQVVMEMLPHNDWVTSAAFDQKGKRIITASVDKTAKIWDVATGKCLKILKGHKKEVWQASFNHTGKLVVTVSSDKTARLWDAATGACKIVLGKHTDILNSAVFSPDGKLVVTASDDRAARVWKVSTGELLAELRGHTGSIFSVAFSHDNGYIVTGSLDSTAMIWEAPTWRSLTPLRGHRGWVNAVACDPEGEFIVTGGGDGITRIWAAKSEQRLIIFTGHKDWINYAAYSPKGDMVVTASADKTAKVWKVPPMQEPQTQSREQRVEKHVTLHGHTGTVRCAVFSPNGKLILTGSNDQTACVWKVRAWKEKTWKPALHLEEHADWVNSVAFSPDGRLAATGSGDETARLWDVSSWQPLGMPIQTKSSVLSVAFSPDSQFLATASFDGVARLWRVGAEPELVHEMRGHDSWLSVVAFSPDGKFILTASGDKTARVWELATGKPVVLLSGHKGVINGAAFNPYGKFIVTAGDDLAARIWETATGKSVAELRGHAGALNSATFSPDGKFILTASDDNTARIYTHTIYDIKDLLALARSRVTRELTPEEREIYLLESSAR